jgi:2-polyprenyl-6-methoxyphenol hydroxylase-like FAD-dependent oxidoreductase
LITPQSRTEDVLTRRLRRLGVSITGGSEVTGVSQDSTGVDVRVRTADGAEGCYRASYVVGTDGVHSAVRAALGLPYPGRSVVRSLMLADVRLADPPADVMAVRGRRRIRLCRPLRGWLVPHLCLEPPKPSRGLCAGRAVRGP